MWGQTAELAADRCNWNSIVSALCNSRNEDVLYLCYDVGWDWEGYGERGRCMGEWRTRAMYGEVENEGDVWGSGERGRCMGEWRTRAMYGGVTNEGDVWGVEN